MYEKHYSAIAKDVLPAQIWALWSDLSKRSIWDDDTEWAKMDGPFCVGNTFYFKPIGGPKLKMTITECTPNTSFTDCYKLPLAKLFGIHEMKPIEEGLLLTTTIKVVGPLTWLWSKILANKIVATLPRQTELLIKAAKSQHE